MHHQNNFMLNYSQDDTLDLLKEFLPQVITLDSQIQQELRNQIQPALEEQFENKTAEQLAKIEQQAAAQYQQALEVLQSQMRELSNQKQQELEAELIQLRLQSNERQRMKLAAAQQKFVQQHFDDRILKHPAMLQLEEQFQSQIVQQMIGRYEIIRDKRVKQLRVRFQNREQKERNQMDKSIRTEIYNKSGLDQLKSDINKFKISLASMKSQYNLRIGKITTDIKQLTAKCKQIQYINSDLLIEQLQAQINQIKQQMVKQNQDNFNQNESNSQCISDSSVLYPRAGNYSLTDHMNRQKGFNMTNQLQPGSKYMEEAQYIDEDIDMQSDDSLDEISQRDSRDRELLPPPQSHPQLLSQLLMDRRQQQNEDQEKNDQVYLQIPQPLLKFNVAKMLRQQWQQDSFDRYLSLRQQKQKQNNYNAQNHQPQNNFSSLYEQHLKKLNRDLKVPKTKKLTEKAKQQLLTNLCSQRQKSMESYI